MGDAVEFRRRRVARRDERRRAMDRQRKDFVAQMVGWTTGSVSNAMAVAPRTTEEIEGLIRPC